MSRNRLDDGSVIPFHKELSVESHKELTVVGSENGTRPPAKPGTKRPASLEDVYALRLLDANESLLKLRMQTIEQAKRISDLEGYVAQLQHAIGLMERDKFMRESTTIRTKYGFVPGQTVLQEELATGSFFVVEQEPKDDPKAQPAPSA